jgi:hypothetical protein
MGERYSVSACLAHETCLPDEPRDEDLQLIPIKTVIDLLQRGQAT